MLWVVVTAAILAVATGGMLRLNAMASQTVSRSEERAQAEAALDGWVSLVKAQAQNRLLLMPSSPSATFGGVLVTGSVTDTSSVMARTAQATAVAVVKGRSYRRTVTVGLPLKETTEAVGLFGTYWQTNGTDSWWEWPPKLTDSPTLMRVDTQFEYSGRTMSFMPDAPSPFVIWEGTLVVPETGTYTFSISADNCWSLWINGSNVYDAFYAGFSHEGYRSSPVNRGLTFNWTKGQRLPFRFYFMDYGGAGRLTFRWQAPGNTAYVPVPADVFRPANFVGGTRRSFTIPWRANAVYNTTLEDSPTVVSATPIDLQSLGFYPGDRIRLSMNGGWNAWSWPANREYIFQNMSAVISSSRTINRAPRATNRVPDALNTGLGQITNPHADQANDFWGDQGYFNGTTWSGQLGPQGLTIPAGGRYLFVQGWDSYWGDNGISRLGLNNVVIERGD